MRTLYCACCGQPFRRTSARGPVPLYCSRDCRRQIAVRRRVWGEADWAKGRAAAEAAVWRPESANAGQGRFVQAAIA